LAQISFRFGPKWTAFWPKTISILPQNGLRFAAKWTAFCRKMGCVLPQNGLRFAAKWKEEGHLSRLTGGHFVLHV